MVTFDTDQSLRPMKCEMNPLNKPDGSAILSSGRTEMIAVVHGPVESRIQRLQFDKVSFDTVYQSKEGPKQLAFESAIKTACEAMLYPSLYARNDITLVVQELQNRGGALACAINAGCLALLNTGIELQNLVGAVTCMIDKEGKGHLDPEIELVVDARFVMTAAFDNIDNKLVYLDQEGTCSAQELIALVRICKDIVNKHIFPFYRTVIEKYSFIL